MPSENVATLSVDMPAERLGLRAAPQIAVAAGIFGEPLAEPGVTIGSLLWLVTLGVVAIMAVAAFFGPGFVLLAHREEVLATRSRASEVRLVPPVQTVSASEVRLSYLTSSAVVALPPRSRLFAAKIAKGRATRNAQPGITFEQYRDIEDLRQRQVRLELKLPEPNLSATERDRRLRQRFDELDANHDGKLDSYELGWRANHRSGD